ncbi:hypothetical protein BLNAU_9044 [Blattamonas nauphoetae]|uniref:Uncharacterized protein n=1 Tax=Blattamonas nauphoetae TaxID=2049346 RepID=A0ABQ9XX50_9EUKA|nr:hypothetical protein BLNAU_9044 [Blattamonas nauphoetae]
MKTSNQNTQMSIEFCICVRRLLLPVAFQVSQGEETKQFRVKLKEIYSHLDSIRKTKKNQTEEALYAMTIALSCLETSFAKEQSALLIDFIVTRTYKTMKSKALDTVVHLTFIYAHAASDLMRKDAQPQARQEEMKSYLDTIFNNIFSMKLRIAEGCTILYVQWLIAIANVNKAFAMDYIQRLLQKEPQTSSDNLIALATLSCIQQQHATATYAKTQTLPIMMVPTPNFSLPLSISAPITEDLIALREERVLRFYASHTTREEVRSGKLDKLSESQNPLQRQQYSSEKGNSATIDRTDSFFYANRATLLPTLSAEYQILIIPEPQKQKKTLKEMKDCTDLFPDNNNGDTVEPVSSYLLNALRDHNATYQAGMFTAISQRNSDTVRTSSNTRHGGATLSSTHFFASPRGKSRGKKAQASIINFSADAFQSSINSQTASNYFRTRLLYKPLPYLSPFYTTYSPIHVGLPHSSPIDHNTTRRITSAFVQSIFSHDPTSPSIFTRATTLPSPLSQHIPQTKVTHGLLYGTGLINRLFSNFRNVQVPFGLNNDWFHTRSMTSNLGDSTRSLSQSQRLASSPLKRRSSNSTFVPAQKPAFSPSKLNSALLSSIESSLKKGPTPNVQKPAERRSPQETTIGADRPPLETLLQTHFQTLFDFADRLVVSSDPSQVVQDYAQKVGSVSLLEQLLDYTIHNAFAIDFPNIPRIRVAQFLISLSCLPLPFVRDISVKVLAAACVDFNMVGDILAGFFKVLESMKQMDTERCSEVLECLYITLNRWYVRATQVHTPATATEDNRTSFPIFIGSGNAVEMQVGPEDLARGSFYGAVAEEAPTESALFPGVDMLPADDIDAIVFVFLCSPLQCVRMTAFRILQINMKLHTILSQLSHTPNPLRVGHILSLQSAEIIEAAMPLINAWSLHPTVGEGVVFENIIRGTSPNLVKPAAVPNIVQSLTDYNRSSQPFTSLSSPAATLRAIKIAIWSDDEARVIVVTVAAVAIHNALPRVAEMIFRRHLVPRVHVVTDKLFTKLDHKVIVVKEQGGIEELNCLYQLAGVQSLYFALHSPHVGIGIIPAVNMDDPEKLDANAGMETVNMLNRIVLLLMSESDDFMKSGLLSLMCAHPTLYRTLFQKIFNPLFSRRSEVKSTIADAHIAMQSRLLSSLSSSLFYFFSALFLPWRRKPTKFLRQLARTHSLVDPTPVHSTRPTLRSTTQTRSMGSSRAHLPTSNLGEQDSLIILQPVVVWDMIRATTLVQMWMGYVESKLKTSAINNPYLPASWAFFLISRRNQLKTMRILYLHDKHLKRTIKSMHLPPEQTFVLYPHTTTERVPAAPTENPLMPPSPQQNVPIPYEVFFPPNSLFPAKPAVRTTVSMTIVPAYRTTSVEAAASDSLDQSSCSIMTSYARNVSLSQAQYLHTYIRMSEMTSQVGIAAKTGEESFVEEDSDESSSEVETLQSPLLHEMAATTMISPQAGLKVEEGDRGETSASPPTTPVSTQSDFAAHTVPMKLLSRQNFITSSLASLPALQPTIAQQEREREPLSDTQTANVRLRSCMYPPIQPTNASFFSSAHRYSLFVHLYSTLFDKHYNVDVFCALRIRPNETVSPPTATAFDSEQDAAGVILCAMVGSLYKLCLEMMSILLDSETLHPTFFSSAPVPRQADVLSELKKVESAKAKPGQNSDHSLFLSLDDLDAVTTVSPFFKMQDDLLDSSLDILFAPDILLTNRHNTSGRRVNREKMNVFVQTELTPQTKESMRQSLLSKDPPKAPQLQMASSTVISNTLAQLLPVTSNMPKQPAFMRRVRYCSEMEVERTVSMLKSTPVPTLFECVQILHNSITPTLFTVVWDVIRSYSPEIVTDKTLNLFIPQHSPKLVPITPNPACRIPSRPAPLTNLQNTHSSPDVQRPTIRTLSAPSSHFTFVMPLSDVAYFFPAKQPSSFIDLPVNTHVTASLNAATEVLGELGVSSSPVYPKPALGAITSPIEKVSQTEKKAAALQDRATAGPINTFSLSDIRSVGTGLRKVHPISGGESLEFSLSGNNRITQSSVSTNQSTARNQPVNLTGFPTVNSDGLIFLETPSRTCTIPAPIWYTACVPFISPEVPSFIAKSAPSSQNVSDPLNNTYRSLSVLHAMGADVKPFGMAPYSAQSVEQVESALLPILFEAVSPWDVGNRWNQRQGGNTQDMLPALEENLLLTLLSRPGLSLGGDGIVLDWIVKCLRSTNHFIRKCGMKGLVRYVRNNPSCLSICTEQCYSHFHSAKLCYPFIGTLTKFFPSPHISTVSALVVSLALLTSIDPRSRSRALSLLVSVIRVIEVEMKKDDMEAGKEKTRGHFTQEKTSHSDGLRVKMTRSRIRHTSSPSFPPPTDGAQTQSQSEQSNDETDSASENDFFIAPPEMDAFNVFPDSDIDSSSDEFTHGVHRKKMFTQPGANGYTSVLRQIQAVLFTFAGDVPQKDSKRRRFVKTGGDLQDNSSSEDTGDALTDTDAAYDSEYSAVLSDDDNSLAEDIDAQTVQLQETGLASNIFRDDDGSVSERMSVLSRWTKKRKASDELYLPTINAQDSETVRTVQSSISHICAHRFPHLFPLFFAEVQRQFSQSQRHAQEALLAILEPWMVHLFAIQSLRVANLRTFIEFSFINSAFFPDAFSRLWRKAVRNLDDFKLVALFIVSFGSDILLASNSKIILQRVPTVPIGDQLAGKDIASSLARSLNQNVNPVNPFMSARSGDSNKLKNPEEIRAQQRFLHSLLSNQDLFHLKDIQDIPSIFTSSALFHHHLTSSSFDAAVGHIIAAISPQYGQWLSDFITFSFVPRPLSNAFIHLVNNNSHSFPAASLPPCHCRMHKYGFMSPLSLSLLFCTSPQLNAVVGAPHELLSDLALYAVPSKDDQNPDVTVTPGASSAAHLTPFRTTFTTFPNNQPQPQAPTKRPQHHRAVSLTATHLSNTIMSLTTRRDITRNITPVFSPLDDDTPTQSHIPQQPLSGPKRHLSLYSIASRGSVAETGDSPVSSDSLYYNRKSARAGQSKSLVSWKESPAVINAYGCDWQIQLGFVVHQIWADSKGPWQVPTPQELKDDESLDSVRMLMNPASIPQHIPVVPAYQRMTTPSRQISTRIGFDLLFNQIRYPIKFYADQPITSSRSSLFSLAEPISVKNDRGGFSIPPAHEGAVTERVETGSSPLQQMEHHGATTPGPLSALKERHSMHRNESELKSLLSLFSSPKQTSEHSFLELRMLDAFFSVPLVTLSIEYVTSDERSTKILAQTGKIRHNRTHSYTSTGQVVPHSARRQEFESPPPERRVPRGPVRPKHARSKTMMAGGNWQADGFVRASRSPVSFVFRDTSSPSQSRDHAAIPETSSLHRTSLPITTDGRGNRQPRMRKKSRSKQMKEKSVNSRMMEEITTRINLLESLVGSSMSTFTSLLMKDMCVFGRSVLFRMPGLWHDVFANPLSVTPAYSHTGAFLPELSHGQTLDLSTVSRQSHEKPESVREMMEKHVVSPLLRTHDQQAVATLIMSVLAHRSPTVLDGKVFVVIHHCIINLDDTHESTILTRQLLVQSLISISLGRGQQFGEDEAKTYVDSIIANLRDRSHVFWPYELPIPDFPPPSEAAVGALAKLFVSITSSSPEDELLRRQMWATYALQYALTARDCHSVSRSLHIFRAVVVQGSVDDCRALLLDVLRCLCYPTFENLSLVTEFLVTLEHLLSTLDDSVLSASPDLFWCLAALLRSDFVPVFFWTCRCLQILLAKLKAPLSDENVIRLFLNAMPDESRWDSHFEGILPLLIRGLFTRATEQLTYALLIQILPVIHLPMFSTLNSPLRVIIGVFLPLFFTTLRNITRTRTVDSLCPQIPSTTSQLHTTPIQMSRQNKRRRLWFDDDPIAADLEMNPTADSSAPSPVYSLVQPSATDDDLDSPRDFVLGGTFKHDDLSLPLLDRRQHADARCGIVALSDYHSPMDGLENQATHNFFEQQRLLREALTDPWLTSAVPENCPPPSFREMGGFDEKQIAFLKEMEEPANASHVPVMEYLAVTNEDDRRKNEKKRDVFKPSFDFHTLEKPIPHLEKPSSFEQSRIHLASVASIDSTIHPTLSDQHIRDLSFLRSYSSYPSFLAPPPSSPEASAKEVSYYAAKIAVACVKAGLSDSGRVLLRYSLGMQTTESELVSEMKVFFVSHFQPPLDEYLLDMWLRMLQQGDNRHHISILQILRAVFLFIEVPSQKSALRKTIGLQAVEEACRYLSTPLALYAWQLLDVVLHRSLLFDPASLNVGADPIVAVDVGKGSRGQYQLHLNSGSMNGIDLSKQLKHSLQPQQQPGVPLSPIGSEQNANTPVLDSTTCFCRTRVEGVQLIAPLGMLATIAINGLFNSEQSVLRTLLPRPGEAVGLDGNDSTYEVRHNMMVSDGSTPSDGKISLADGCMLIAHGMECWLGSGETERAKRKKKKAKEQPQRPDTNPTTQIKGTRKEEEQVADCIRQVHGEAPFSDSLPTKQLSFLRRLWTWSSRNGTNQMQGQFDRDEQIPFASPSPFPHKQSLTSLFTLPLVSENSCSAINSAFASTPTFGPSSLSSRNPYLSLPLAVRSLACCLGSSLRLEKESSSFNLTELLQRNPINTSSPSPTFGDVNHSNIRPQASPLLQSSAL